MFHHHLGEYVLLLCKHQTSKSTYLIYGKPFIDDVSTKGFEQSELPSRVFWHAEEKCNALRHVKKKHGLFWGCWKRVSLFWRQALLQWISKKKVVQFDGIVFSSAISGWWSMFQPDKCYFSHSYFTWWMIPVVAMIQKRLDPQNGAF